MAHDAPAEREQPEDELPAELSAVPPHKPEKVADILEDEKTDEAVDDIVAHEGDEILEAEDTAARRAGEHPKRGFWGSIGHFFGLWFGTPRGRWLTFLVLVAAAGTVAAIPTARYWFLNTVGVRSSASVIVVDSVTQLPLKGVAVKVANSTAQTKADGTASFSGLRLGKTQLTIAQPGFAGVQQQVTIGWGSNPLGSFGLKATGAQYTIVVHDYLSDKPVAGVLAASGDATALSDDSGKITLTLEHAADANTPVTLSKDGYRTDQITLKPTNQNTNVTLVLSRKAVFVSKANGNYDVYKSDIDGANKEVLLKATGSEDDTTSLVSSLDGTHAALVSTRDNQRDSDGNLVHTLTLITVDDGTAVTLGHAGQIRLLAWPGSRLVFEQVSADSATPAGGRYGIISYDYSNNSRAQLVATQKLNTAFSAQGAIYYAVAPNDANTSPQPGFYRINPDGSGRQTELDKEVTTSLRTDYNTLALQTADGWKNYTIGSGAVADISGPASFVNRLYLDSADRSHSLWVNQGVLLSYDVAGSKDAAIQTQTGLGYPLRWLTDDATIYRVSANGETADYAKSLTGGTAHKIADVSNTTGFTAGQ